MKLKALTLALLVAGLSASIAVAGNPGKGNGNGNGHGNGAPVAAASTTSSSSTTTTAGHGKSAGHKPVCKARQFVIGGTVAGAPAAGSFALAVSSGNANGSKLAGKQLTVDASHAKVVKQGRKTVADLAQGDRVLVKGKTCQAVDGTAAFVASQVVVLGAKGSGSGDDGDTPKATSTTSSSTSTTSSSTSTTTSTTAATTTN